MIRTARLSLASLMLISLPMFAKSDDKGAAALPPVDNAGAPAPLPPVTGDETVAPVVADQVLLNNSQPTVSLEAAKAKAERIKPVLTAVASGFAVPVKADRPSTGVGGQPLYNFDGLLNINDSFGVFNKTASQIASTITGANKRHRLQAVNDDGSAKFEAIKDANGAVIGVSTTPVEVAGKVFRAYDVDVKTFYPEGTPDDQKAPTRVWLVEHNTKGLPLPKAAK